MFVFFRGFAKRLKDSNDRLEIQHKQQLKELEEQITTKQSLEIYKLKTYLLGEINKYSYCLYG